MDNNNQIITSHVTNEELMKIIIQLYDPNVRFYNKAESSIIKEK